MTWSRPGGAGYREVCAVMCSTVRHLRDNAYFVRFSGGGAHAAHWECGCRSTWPPAGDVVQAKKLPTPFEDNGANFDVDDHVGNDDDPDRCIERGNPEVIPVCTHPAPELRTLEMVDSIDSEGTYIG